MDYERALLTIGQVARRTGMPVRTVRYWSDEGLVSVAGRTQGGYRLYDAEAVARLELVATLRQLGLGLAEVRRLLEDSTTVAEVAAAHVEALDDQIRALRLRRGLLATVAKRASSTEEMALMNRLAQLSPEQRKRLIDEFVDEVFSGLETETPGIQAGMRMAPELPDDPTPEQVDAWVELAELVQDHDFRRRVRTMAERGAEERRRGGPPAEGTAEEDAGYVNRVEAEVGEAVQRGISPESSEAAEIVDRILGDARTTEARQTLLRQLETFTDARVERYWQLVAIINGWTPVRTRVPAFQWLIAALHAHG